MDKRITSTLSRTAITSASLGLAALIGAGSVYAAQDQVKPRMDVDGNGVVTRAEAQSRATALFARMDVNHDGKLDQADRLLRRETMKTYMFERLDADKNGKISKAEFMADRGPTRSDQGRRGHGWMMSEAGKDGGAHFGRARGRQRGGLAGIARRADGNGDGAVTEAEFASAALTRFDAMDINKDGQVTQPERQAAREQMKARAQARTQSRTQN